MASEEVFDPLTRYQCCPPTCGAAAAVALLGRLREEARASRSPVWIAGAGDDDRLRVELREEHDQDGRLRHDRERRQEGLRAGGPRPGRRAGRRAARLLHGQRDPHLRGRSASARRARPRSSSGTGRTPTAASSSPTRRAACSRRATRSARRASRSARSSCGSCAARPTSARCRTRRSRSSTTSASAAPASSRCTERTNSVPARVLARTRPETGARFLIWGGLRGSETAAKAVGRRYVDRPSASTTVLARPKSGIGHPSPGALGSRSEAS